MNDGIFVKEINNNVGLFCIAQGHTNRRTLHHRYIGSIRVISGAVPKAL